MMTLLRHVFLYVALLAAIAGIATTGPAGPAAAQDLLRIAAVVNEDIISELDIYMRLRMAMLARVSRTRRKRATGWCRRSCAI